MTAAEYARAYRRARASLPSITRQTMRELKQTYIEAARLAAAEVARAEMAGYAEITVKSWEQIEQALLEGAREIQRHLDEAIPLAAKDIAGSVTRIDEMYLVEALDRAQAGIDLAKVKNLFLDVSDKVVRSLVNRVYTDGYSFSQRIWRASGAYKDAMKRVLTEGLAAGRDVVDLAADLNAYVKSGRAGLMQRWGKLVEGEADFARRIRKDVDYNALRLVRSELYMSLQDSAKLDGVVNPACTGMYDWVRTDFTDWGCECPDLAANSPYPEDQIPEYPHPSCSCLLIPRLMDASEFIADLKAWARGADVGYLDEWNRDYYQKAAA